MHQKMERWLADGYACVLLSDLEPSVKYVGEETKENKAKV